MAFRNTLKYSRPHSFIKGTNTETFRGNFMRKLWLAWRHLHFLSLHPVVHKREKRSLWSKCVSTCTEKWPRHALFNSSPFTHLCLSRFLPRWGHRIWPVAIWQRGCCLCSEGYQYLLRRVNEFRRARQVSIAEIRWEGKADRRTVFQHNKMWSWKVRANIAAKWERNGSFT